MRLVFSPLLSIPTDLFFIVVFTSAISDYQSNRLHLRLHRGSVQFDWFWVMCPPLLLDHWIYLLIHCALDFCVCVCAFIFSFHQPPERCVVCWRTARTLLCSEGVLYILLLLLLLLLPPLPQGLLKFISHVSYTAVYLKREVEIVVSFSLNASRSARREYVFDERTDRWKDRTRDWL